MRNIVLMLLLSASVRGDVFSTHPAAETLARLFPADAPPTKVTPTGLTRAHYLGLMAGNVDFFKQHQNAAGAIIDPYEKAEKQYSTPAFALAAALLVTEKTRDDLLDPATRALSFSIAALSNHTTADGHADFYIPMVMHARRLLAARVPKETADRWTAQLTALIPEKTYRDITAGNNWNLVNVTGEMMRRKDGLVQPEQVDAHLAYLNRSMEKQLKRFTPMGQYEDPNAPLAYDVFPRLWLEDALADGAYIGNSREQLDDLLAKGGLTSLLLLSPTGEWPCGGRSAHHQWNEAAFAVVAECKAARWKKLGRPDIAGSFKRAAHLALASLQRWQRPSGELWIVKNHADPANRFGYEGYSYHSQYNLLSMAMLAIAYTRADDSIAEALIPAESGAYVLDLREHFHKVIATAGGYYIEIDTVADNHYNATGLQRIHRAGVPFSPLSDSSPSHRSFGPNADKSRRAISLGFPKIAESAEKSVDLKTAPIAGDQVSFTLTYGDLGQESYTLSSAGLEVTVTCPITAEAQFPLLVTDGTKEYPHEVQPTSFTNGPLKLELLGDGKLTLQPDRFITHNGHVQAVTTKPTKQLRYRISLTAQP